MKAYPFNNASGNPLWELGAYGQSVWLDYIHRGMLSNGQNIMIKVPATKEGIFAFEQLIGEGINVNVTLLSGNSRHCQYQIGLNH